MQQKTTPSPQRNLAKKITALTLSFAIPFLLILLGNQFLLKNYIVPSASMETTLMTGDRIFGNIIHGEPNLQRGQIIIFKDTQRWLPKTTSTNYLVKRIIGLPGDTINCCTENGKLLINGEPYTETYIPQNSNQTFTEQKIPEGYVFVLGDNRKYSADSRYHIKDNTQFIPIKDIESTVAFRYWPLSTFGTIE